MEGIPRTAYYIATKVGRYQPEVDRMFDFSAERTLQSVDESLQRMGLDYVDVIQVRVRIIELFYKRYQNSANLTVLISLTKFYVIFLF